MIDRRAVPVLQVITRMIIGGAQETVMLTAAGLRRPPYDAQYRVAAISGRQTGPEGSLIEETRARGVPLELLPSLRREIHPTADLAALAALRRRMRGPAAPRYHIVHTHSSKAGVLGRLAARSAGVPIVVHTVHGWSFHERMPAATRLTYITLERAAARLSDAMIVVSPLDIEKGLAHGIGRREDYVLIRSGIELERFGHPSRPREEIRTALGIPVDAPVVGSVTRLSPQKAPLDLLAAWEQVHRAHPDCWFLVVGDGPLRPAVEARLTATSLGGRTILTGLRRDVPDLLAAMDIFALSSLWEGLPRVLPQAMAGRLPIVATAADGNAEAVVDGETGYLVPPGDPRQLAARLSDLLTDPVRRDHMGSAGQSHARRFAADTMVADTDALYRRLIEARGRPRFDP